MTAYPRRLNFYFQTFLPGVLVRELSEQDRLLQSVRASLPPALASQCRYCIKKREQLIIQVDSSATATLLRFQAPSLLAHMAREHGFRFTDVQVQNLISASSEAAAVTTATTPGAKASRHIKDSADGCTSDEIRCALLRLSKTLDQQEQPKSQP
jgi:hypothetical protein